MAKNNGYSLNLPSLDDLFTTEEEREDAKLEKVVLLPPENISEFPNHPFQVRMDDAMKEMAQSVREYGVLVPALVRPKEGGYEMVSGHRRKRAAELAGLREIPCIIRNLTDDQAIVIMVDSNLQREQILPSEKAFAYKMKMEAVKRTAGRPRKEKLGQVVPNLGKRTTELAGEANGESYKTVQRYIRLTHLIPSILQMVDDYQIAFNPAVEISYLTEEHQRMLKEEMDACQATPSLTQSRTLKQMSQAGTLTREYLHHLLTEEKPNQRQKFFLNQEDVQRYFPKHYTPQQMQQVILHLLHTWQHKRGYNKDTQER